MFKRYGGEADLFTGQREGKSGWQSVPMPMEDSLPQPSWTSSSTSDLTTLPQSHTLPPLNTVQCCAFSALPPLHSIITDPTIQWRKAGDVDSCAVMLPVSQRVQPGFTLCLLSAAAAKH